MACSAARKGGAFAQALVDAGAEAARSMRWVPTLPRAASAPAISSKGLRLVDYGGFVDLAADATRVCAWL